MKNNFRRLRVCLFISIAILQARAAAWACDPCALVNSWRLREHSEGAVTLSLSEQYTEFDRSEEINGEELRDAELVKGFSTTQFSAAYDATENVGFQITLPMIVRRFDEIEDFDVDSDMDAGIGDLVLSGSYSFVNYKEGDWGVVVSAIGGFKLATGDTGVIRETSAHTGGDDGEEHEEDGHDGHEEHAEEDAHMHDEGHIHENLLKHHIIGGASGGRALTFGTGSYDYIAGLNFLNRYQKYLLLGYAQYTFRTEGDFNYEFADEFLWSISPGYYLSLNDESSTAILVNFSGEFKGKDKLENDLVQGSEVSNLYLGPGVFVTLSDGLGIEAAMDFRVTGDDVDSQVAPEYKIRAGLSWRLS